MKDYIDKFKTIVKIDDKKIDMTIREIVESGIDIEQLYESLIKFEDLRGSGKKKANIIDYIKAVEFCTYVVSGLDYTVAYKKTFPDRVEKHIKNGKEEWISRYANIYANGELVGSIMARIYMNQHIMFIDKAIKAKLELYDIGMNGNSEKNRVDALDKFLNHIKKEQEKAGIDINMTVNSNTIEELDKKMNQLADLARGSMKIGAISATDVANTEVIDIEPTQEQ